MHDSKQKKLAQSKIIISGHTIFFVLQKPVFVNITGGGKRCTLEKRRPLVPFFQRTGSMDLKYDELRYTPCQGEKLYHCLGYILRHRGQKEQYGIHHNCNDNTPSTIGLTAGAECRLS